jgi:hypothetical protein
MLEVKKLSSEELQERDRAAQPAPQPATGSPDKLTQLVKTATSVRALHDVLDRRATLKEQRLSYAETRRFRVSSVDDEEGKRFVAIDVLSQFL